MFLFCFFGDATHRPCLSDLYFGIYNGSAWDVLFYRHLAGSYRILVASHRLAWHAHMESKIPRDWAGWL